MSARGNPEKVYVLLVENGLGLGSANFPIFECPVDGGVMFAEDFGLGAVTITGCLGLSAPLYVGVPFADLCARR